MHGLVGYIYGQNQNDASYLEVGYEGTMLLYRRIIHGGAMRLTHFS